MQNTEQVVDRLLDDMIFYKANVAMMQETERVMYRLLDEVVWYKAKRKPT